VSDRFYLHEDDWAMIDLLPVEDRPHAEASAREAEAFAEAHRAPGGAGWTAMYVVPAPPNGIAARALDLPSLGALLGPAWHAYDGIDSGYSSYREEIGSAYALTDGHSVLYGNVDGRGLITGLHLHGPDPASAADLVRAGAALRLILVDHWSDQVIDLADRPRVEEYLTDTDDEH
jgi:hypothetical protein